MQPAWALRSLLLSPVDILLLFPPPPPPPPPPTTLLTPYSLLFPSATPFSSTHRRPLSLLLSHTRPPTHTPSSTAGHDGHEEADPTRSRGTKRSGRERRTAICPRTCGQNVHGPRATSTNRCWQETSGRAMTARHDLPVWQLAGHRISGRGIRRLSKL